MSEHKEGDIVTLTVTGMVSQKTTSGYVVTMHGVDVPFVGLDNSASVLVHKILEILEQFEKDITHVNPISIDYIYKVVAMRSAIKELCLKEIGREPPGD